MARRPAYSISKMHWLQRWGRGASGLKVVKVKAFRLAFFIVGDHQILTFRCDRDLGLRLTLRFLLCFFCLFFLACALLLPLAKR